MRRSYLLGIAPVLAAGRATMGRRVGGCNTGAVSGWGGNITATLRR